MTLYAFGSNGCGQLGIGDTEDTCIPQRCKLMEEQQWPASIRTVQGGGSHTLILLESGDLYASGSLVSSPSVESISKFSRISNDNFGGSKVRLCSALWEASIIVTFNDEMYALGSGSKGELGLGIDVARCYEKLERFWPQGEQIVDLSSGMSHTIAVLSNGDVYGWGNGRKGQLGEPAEIVWKPRKIRNLTFKVVRALCGREFSFLLRNPKDGHYVILGADKYGIRSDAPAAIPGWTDLGVSWGSIFVISESGDFFAWGRNDHGQTGPKRPPGALVRIAAGSEHTLALTDSGTIAARGWGEHGNCGPGVDSHGDVKGLWNEIHPDQFVKGSKVAGIAAGCATSFAWILDAYDQHRTN
ncbi:MAG: hypothetical protein L6R41_005994 [Letrouitia leprolyta]|nr:MAG: hypothetical protein L6R41_005994 [Letrouitia leprolyta]